MGVPTHAMVYSGGSAATMGTGAGPQQFLGPLRMLDGVENWHLLLYPLPAGRSFEDLRGQITEQYIQAAGTAEAMTVEMRKPGGRQWGVNWVRCAVGRHHPAGQPPDVAITLPHGSQTVIRAEVFDADEAAQLFMHYHRAGDIPDGYVLRPVEGYTTDGTIIDLAGTAA